MCSRDRTGGPSQWNHPGSSGNISIRMFFTANLTSIVTGIHQRASLSLACISQPPRLSSLPSGRSASPSPDILPSVHRKVECMRVKLNYCMWSTQHVKVKRTKHPTRERRTGCISSTPIVTESRNKLCHFAATGKHSQSLSAYPLFSSVFIVTLAESQVSLCPARCSCHWPQATTRCIGWWTAFDRF